jgi:hypothetical protein
MYTHTYIHIGRATMDEPQGLVESSFVRKAFYTTPPEKGASVEEWNEWLRQDRAQAIAAKRAHTISLPRGIPDVKPMVVAKIGGVYKQTAMVGLVSEGEDQTRLEPAVEATQDRVVLSAWDHIGGRGVSTAKRRNNSKRAKAKAARRARKS